MLINYTYCIVRKDFRSILWDSSKSGSRYRPRSVRSHRKGATSKGCEIILDKLFVGFHQILTDTCIVIGDFRNNIRRCRHNCLRSKH